jgi:hypothetical protein
MNDCDCSFAVILTLIRLQSNLLTAFHTRAQPTPKTALRRWHSAAVFSSVFFRCGRRPRSRPVAATRTQAHWRACTRSIDFCCTTKLSDYIPHQSIVQSHLFKLPDTLACCCCFMCIFLQVWQASNKQASSGNADTGALARLHPQHRLFDSTKTFSDHIGHHSTVRSHI